jgi:hypothetical protein
MAILYLLIFVFCLPSFSWGYVDPGSISLLLQVIIAFFLGGLLSFRTRIINKVKYISNLIISKKKTNYEKNDSTNKK